MAPTPAPEPLREVLTWDAFGGACRALAQAVADDGWLPDVVVAVARGGLTVAGGVAYALGVKNCGAINVEFYTGVETRLAVPILLPPTFDLVDVEGLRTLVVDDVADTGHTLRLVREVLAQHVAEARNSALGFIAGHTVAELEELGLQVRTVREAAEPASRAGFLVK